MTSLALPLWANISPSSDEAPSGLFGIAPGDLETLWKWKPPEGSLSQLITIDKNTYAVAPTAGIWRLSDKGFALWHASVSDAAIVGSHLDQLWVQSGSRELVAIDQKYGYVRWRHRFSQPLACNAYTFAQSLCVIDANNLLWRIDTVSGQKSSWAQLPASTQRWQLGASTMRDLLVVGDTWWMIDTVSKKVKALDAALPLPLPNLAQWQVELNGVYYIAKDGFLTRLEGNNRLTRWSQCPGVSRYYLLNGPMLALYQPGDGGGSLAFYKDGVLQHREELTAEPVAVTSIDSTYVLVQPKGAVVGIDQRTWKQVFALKLDSPPLPNQPVTFSDETLVYLNYERSAIATMVLVDLF